MGKLRENRSLRVSTWVLFAASVFAALFFAQQFLAACLCTEWGGWTSTYAFLNARDAWQSQMLDYVQYQVDLSREDLDYADMEQRRALAYEIERAMSPEYSNFRYQVLNSDGTAVLYSNLEEPDAFPEEQIVEVYYGKLDLQDDGVVSFQTKNDSSSVETGANSGYEGELVSQDPAFVRYGVLQPEHMTAQDEFYRIYTMNSSYAHYQLLYAGLCLVLASAALVLFLFLLWAAGHRPGDEKVVLTFSDRIFSEVWLLVVLFATLVLYGGRYYYNLVRAVEAADQEYIYVLIAAFTVAGGAWILLMSAFLRTLVVRLKARALARTTLLCRVVKFLWKRVEGFFRDLPLAWKAVLSFFLYLAAIFLGDHLWPLRYYYPLPGILINLIVLLGLCWWSASFWRVRKGTEVIAAGNLNHQIETAHLPWDLKRHAEALNNISGGLTNAVNEQMKSERFKAELITNVSHDLKTPLTSIINYVNLLKTTEQTDAAAREYIDVLDRKSQRLKKLTEDLVEASKASTGSLTVNREKIGMAQLLDQALGEYEERLESKHLTVVPTVPEGESYVYADGRHVWRVLDNLLSNCAKYALEGTRVYIEIARGKGSVSLSVKNISREPLNVPPERLLERFVRGEESRTTEGSGLGLSIAKSLTELQGGTFQLVVDGDLFKAIVTLPQAS